MITVALADDHEIVRTGFKMILADDPEIEIVGEASDGASAVILATKMKPDVLLMDLSMPPFQSGLAAISDVVSKCPETKVIILTMFSDVDYLRYAMNHGAWGYVVKNASADELLGAVHSVFEGQKYIHPSMAAQLGDEGLEFDADDKKRLSSREIEILSLLAMGYTNREISERLFLSVKTIEAHRSKIYSKLEIDSRAELVEYALKHGLMNV